MWYSFKASKKGTLTVTLNPTVTKFRGAVMIYTGSSASALTQVGYVYVCGDGSLVCARVSGVVSGRVYSIVVMGTSSNYARAGMTSSGRGPFQLTWTLA